KMIEAVRYRPRIESERFMQAGKKPAQGRIHRSLFDEGVKVGNAPKSPNIFLAEQLGQHHRLPKIGPGVMIDVRHHQLPAVEIVESVFSLVDIRTQTELVNLEPRAEGEKVSFEHVVVSEFQAAIALKVADKSLVGPFEANGIEELLNV